jgi:ferric-dicitrate binding protein FerR (iron transport regulator)
MAGEADATELEELQKLLEASPELKESIPVIENYWNSASEKTEYEERESALEKHMLRIHAEENINAGVSDKSAIQRFLSGRKGKLVGAIAVAASVVVFITISSLFFFQDQRSVKAFKTLYASNGSKNHFLLPDGSKVWLNAGSSLKYPVSLSKDSIREVYLSGEAFFEIQHDEKHPFWIRTNQMDILDIGTKFNVKAYPTDKTVEATLVEGSIEVKINHLNHSEILSQPNEKITVFTKDENYEVSGSADQTKNLRADQKAAVPVYKISKVIPQSEDSLVAETAWMKDMLVFQNQNFQELATLMERWYDVTITFENENLKQHRFTGVFADETIEQALNQIKLVRRFDYSIIDGKVIIKEKTE